MQSIFPERKPESQGSLTPDPDTPDREKGNKHKKTPFFLEVEIFEFIDSLPLPCSGNELWPGNEADIDERGREG